MNGRMDGADTRAPDRRRPPPRACARLRPTLNPTGRSSRRSGHGPRLARRWPPRHTGCRNCERTRKRRNRARPAHLARDVLERDGGDPGGAKRHCQDDKRSRRDGPGSLGFDGSERRLQHSKSNLFCTLVLQTAQIFTTHIQAGQLIMLHCASTMPF